VEDHFTKWKPPVPRLTDPKSTQSGKHERTDDHMGGPGKDRPASEVGDATLSGLPVEPIYTKASLDADGFDVERDLGAPGGFPFTRGVATGGYRERLWVMGQYSGFGSAQETNKRIRGLIEQGQAGFSVALDLPTQIGLDSDDPRAFGEVGRVGVPIDTLEDMVDLLDGIPLDRVRQIRTTANSVGPIFVALFLAAAERHGYSGDQFRVMFQNDVLKEYVARGTYIFPPRPAKEFSVDVIEYCAQHLPHWEPIEFCGYHIRDAGANAIQEVAIALGNAIEYLDAAQSRGVNIDSIAHALYIFLSAGQDLFEEVAKFRAARRIWARLAKDRYGVAEANCRLNIFAYTLGSPQTLQEPLNNIVRIAYEALAAVLGGAQTLATTAYDEALQLPSDDAVRISLRTQQILAYETGVARSGDPLGGSYLVESLTTALERAITSKLEQIDREGGALLALESGWIGREIDEESFKQQAAAESGARIVVGVNRFRVEESTGVQHHVRINEQLEAQQRSRLREVKNKRDPGKVASALGALETAAKTRQNTVPPLVNAVKVNATIGEIASTLKSVWGEYRP
jgi:methylmalonyl-CoA mutase, N-terminal domain